LTKKEPEEVKENIDAKEVGQKLAENEAEERDEAAIWEDLTLSDLYIVFFHFSLFFLNYSRKFRWNVCGRTNSTQNLPIVPQSIGQFWLVRRES
jgi:hypothetical protein